jgi:hypothetical protein
MSTARTQSGRRWELAQLRDAHRDAERIASDITLHAQYARGDGATWQEIGHALGITKQAAQQRYGYRPATAADYEAAGVLPEDYPGMTVLISR